MRVTYPLDYLLCLPEDYSANRRTRWPLVVFLHGLGERGPDLNAVKRHGLPRLAEAGMKFPFILVSPQCPADSWWNAAAIDAFVATICSQLRVDLDRVYLTGLSMGGYGTWTTACFNPARYAAIAPICGGGEVRHAAQLRQVPVWAFHGAKDRVVRPARSQAMVKGVRDAGGSAKLTVFPRLEHNSWDPAYAKPELLTWLLAQRRARPSTARP
ncbi:phospholipase [Nibricoccus aquaticus]|uniref:Phospholipase n=1 Tax=Nibricoccus aquaticus TaxID=2576891 RepID=A0A290QC47_9BACT|nr:phospholipase [Nibricoccus aquaticus]